jgi:hypothetical protein
VTDGKNDEKPKTDLSSLISLPSSDDSSAKESSSSSNESSEPIEFESIEELSQAPEVGASDGAGLDATAFETSGGEAAAGLPDFSSDFSPGFSSDSPGLDASSGATPGTSSGAMPSTSPGGNFETLQNATTEAPAVDASLEPASAIDSIKRYSENIAVPLQAGAAFPFTLKIVGMLTPQESEKLMTVLTREKMGFREVDIEPQLTSGRILIPRISEYAGIMLIQALRGISAKIYFGPADEIFSTPDTRDDTRDDESLTDAATSWNSQDEKISQHSERSIAEHMPVTATDSFPQFSKIEIIDIIVTSGILSTRSIEAANSPEYVHLLEGLIRELKFKANRRGANGILSLNIQLTPLTLPTDYRVTVTGSAIKTT